MASFTDNPQALTNFNPYVSQLPVEAMVKVGMQKQQQYDEGIQKIQTNIDNVAGLDISRDVDKAYLQSKLNQLGSDSRIFAMSDFSNSQIVNSVNGMTNSIVKDRNIQNAVSSTAKLRKEQQYKEEARKAGKSSIQNDWKFNQGANEYLNSTDLKESYTGRYKDYVNMDEKLRKVAKDIHESNISYDNPFQRDAAGNTLYYDAKGNASTDPTKGSPRQDDAMLHVELKAKSAQKILNTFYDSLTPDDIEQLSIDGQYHYRGATIDTFKETINSNYEKDKKILSEASTEIALKIQTEKLSPAQKAQYEAQLNKINEKLNEGGLEKSRDEQLAKIGQIKDVEDYKGKLYSQSWLTNLAQDISYEDKKTELKTNPYEQANDRRLQLQLAYDREAREGRQFQMTFARDNAHWEYEQAAKAAEAADKKKKETFSAVDAGQLSTSIDTPTINKLSQSITSITGKRNAKGEILQQGAIDRLNLTAFPLIPGGAGMSNKQKESYLKALSDKYATNPGSINGISNNPGLRKYLESRRTLEIDLASKRKLYVDVQKESKKRGYDQAMDGVLAKVNGVAFSNGKQMYSAKELYQFQSRVEALSSVLTSSGTVGKALDYKQLEKEYKGTKYEPLARAAIKNYLGSGNMSPTEKTLAWQSKKVWVDNFSTLKAINDKKLKFETDYLAKYSPERQTQVGTLNTSNKDTRARISGLVGNLLEKQNKLGAFDVDKLSDGDRDMVRSLLSTGGTTYTIEKKADGSATLIMLGSIGSGDKKKSVRQTLPITAKELRNHFGEIAQMNPLNEAKKLIESSKDRTTNLFNGQGTAGAVTSRYSGYDLPQLRNSSIAPRVRFDIEGDPNNDGSGDDGYTIKMYVQPYGSSRWVDGYLNQDYVSLSGIQETINNIGDITIDSFLTKNK